MPKANAQADARTDRPCSLKGGRVAQAPASRKPPKRKSSRKAGGYCHQVPHRRNTSRTGVSTPKRMARERLTLRREVIGELEGGSGFLLRDVRAVSAMFLTANAAAAQPAAPAVRWSRLVGRTKVSYSHIWLWLHRAALFDYTTDLPVGEGRAPVPTIGRLGHQGPCLVQRGSRPLGRSADWAVWPQRSGGQAASFGSGSGSENVRSELRSNSRARPREFGTRAACSITVASRVSLRLPLFLHRSRRPETSTHPKI